MPRPFRLRRRPPDLRRIARVRSSLLIIVLLCSFAIFAVKSTSYLRRLTGEMAMSDAIDMVQLTICKA